MSGALQNLDGTKKPWKHGKAVVNGQVRFTSVSALNRAEGCLRAWWFRYRGGIQDPPPSAMMARGDRCHAEVARYLSTGDRTHLHDSLILSGLHQLPPPGPDLCVEHDLIPDLPDGSSGLSIAKLRVADIPVTGSIDLMHARPENYGVQDVRDAVDEPGVLKITDHKFTSDVKWAKSATGLVEEIQMAGYAVWAFETFPGLERVRLTHNVFPVKGQPRAPTILVDRDAVQKTWERATALGVSIRDAARESNPDRVDANTGNCHAYGRDCPAIKVCRAARSGTGVSALMGATAAERLRRPRLPVINGEANHVMTISPTSLVGRLQASANQSAAPAAALPTITAPVAAPIPAAAPPSAPEVQAEIAKLTAIEAAVTGSAPAPVDPVVAIVAEIDALGIGRPQIGPPAAAALAATYGSELSGGYTGSGALSEYAASTLDELKTILAGGRELLGIYGTPEKVLEVAAAAKGAAPPPPAPASPESSTSTPTLQTTPDAPPSEKTTKRKPGRPKKQKTEDVPPAAAPTAPTASHPVVDYLDSLPAGLDMKTQTERTIDKWIVEAMSLDTATTTNLAPASPAETNAAPATPVQDDAPAPGPTPQPPGAINVFVDCVVDGLATKSLWPLIVEIWESMTADANAPDPRVAPQDSNYGFGKWKGVLAACLREAPSVGKLPPGNYTLTGSMGDLGNVASETLMQIAQATGGIFVKGAR